MKNNKTSVWLINQYLTTPQLNETGHRHSYLAEEWAKRGYDVTLITSSYSHLGNRHNSFKGLFNIKNGNITTLLIKGNGYKNANGFPRILSWLIFTFLLFFIPTKKLPKPDIIIVSSISLLPILNVVFFFKRKFKNLKFILEIRDIWPLSLIEIGGYSSKNVMIKFLSWVEKLGYKKSNHIVSLLMDAKDHIETILGYRHFNYTWISNGYNIEKSHYYEPLPSIINKGIPNEKFIVGYAGALGKANGMETIIDAFNAIKKENILLCILGNGNEKENLIKRAKYNTNIIFFDSIKKSQVQSFLKQCDLLFFSSKDLNIYRFGISANKTFDYMYAGKPIILSAPTKNNVIEKANCGSVIPAENINELIMEISKYASMTKNERSIIGNRGKSYLIKHFTYKTLALKYINVFDKVLGLNGE